MVDIVAAHIAVALLGQKCFMEGGHIHNRHTFRFHSLQHRQVVLLTTCKITDLRVCQHGGDQDKLAIRIGGTGSVDNGLNIPAVEFQGIEFCAIIHTKADDTQIRAVTFTAEQRQDQFRTDMAHIRMITL